MTKSRQVWIVYDSTDPDVRECLHVANTRGEADREARRADAMEITTGKVGDHGDVAGERVVWTRAGSSKC